MIHSILTRGESFLGKILWEAFSFDVSCSSRLSANDDRIILEGL